MSKPRKEYGRIYDKYIDKIYRFIFLKVNSQEVAEDLCSDTFVRGWQAFQKSQASNPDKKVDKIENIQAFLYKIARNRVIDYYRKKGKFQIISANYREIIDPQTDLEEKAVLNSDMDTIRLALSNLKEDYQDVIILRYLNELSMDEIAQIMDRSEQAVRVLLHRAIKSLKIRLTQLI